MMPYQIGNEVMNNKVLLVSLWGNYNYGNKLQSYALKTLIEKMGYSVVVAKHDEPAPRLRTKIKKAVRTILGRKSNVEPRSNERERYFEEFTNSYVDESITINDFDASQVDTSLFSAAIVGSDQVWHNFFNRKEELEYFFLNFMPEKKRIAYAASFGFDSFPQKYEKLYNDGLKGIRYCSCREKSGCELVEKTIGKPIQQVLDPTLCLTADEWEKIAHKPKYDVPKEYALVYFIAGMPQQYESYIQNLSNSYNIKCIDIYNGGNDYFETTGPREFIWLIKNAKFVYTDSFHASVFSVLFQKQFLVFPRCNETGKGSYGRIEALLQLCSITDCEYGKTKMPFCISNEAFETAKKKINEEKAKSMDFLENALGKVISDC